MSIANKLLKIVFLLIVVNTPLWGQITYTVDRTTDIITDGAGTVGSLRYCLDQANSSAGKDSIHFNISGAVPQTITLSSGALTIIQDVVIDARTQPGYSSLNANPVVILTGSAQQGIFINSGSASLGSLIRGFAINNCSLHAIEINASPNCVIIGNYIGTDETGMIDLGNNQSGINAYAGSHNLKIGGNGIDSSNVISGNTLNGIQINNSNNITVTGNMVGVNSLGNTAISNNLHGIDFVLVNNGIIKNNTSSGNTNLGIQIQTCTGIKIQGNKIGTSKNGDAMIGNSNHGIQIINCPGTIIGGNRLTEGNIISDNGFAAINLDRNPSSPPSNSDNCIIKGNLIGTDITGTQNFGNKGISVIAKSNYLIIGGLINNEENVIVGSGATIPNLGTGLLLANANYATVEGNLIGVGLDSLTPIPNSLDGVMIAVENVGDSAQHNIINNNIIAYNLRHSINVGQTFGPPFTVDNKERFNNLRFNQIYCNGGKGIFINLANSADWGNNGKNAPLINQSLTTSSKITGLANGLLSTDVIDIFEMIDCPNCTDNPQGKKYVTSVSPDALGNWSYDNGSPIAGTFVAMVTDNRGNSSEFSACVTPCEAKAMINPSDESISLYLNENNTLTFTSNSTVSNLNPEPIKIFWSIDAADTTGTNYITSSSSITLNFSPSGAGNTYGLGQHEVFLIAKQSGCIDTSKVTINAFYIPNLITPNKDSKNDQWQITEGSENFNTKIFNRWGELVYSKDGYSNQWITEDVSDGVYYYILEDSSENGKAYKGWLQVIR